MRSLGEKMHEAAQALDLADYFGVPLNSLVRTSDTTSIEKTTCSNLEFVKWVIETFPGCKFACCILHGKPVFVGDALTFDGVHFEVSGFFREYRQGVQNTYLTFVGEGGSRHNLARCAWPVTEEFRRGQPIIVGDHGKGFYSHKIADGTHFAFDCTYHPWLTSEKALGNIRLTQSFRSLKDAELAYFNQAVVSWEK